MPFEYEAEKGENLKFMHVLIFSMDEEILIVNYFKQKSRTWVERENDILYGIVNKGQASLVGEFRQDKNFSQIKEFIRENKNTPISDVKVSDIAAVIVGKKSDKNNYKDIQDAINILANAIEKATNEQEVKGVSPTPMSLFIACVGILTLLHPPRRVGMNINE